MTAAGDAAVLAAISGVISKGVFKGVHRRLRRDSSAQASIYFGVNLNKKLYVAGERRQMEVARAEGSAAGGKRWK